MLATAFALTSIAMPASAAEHHSFLIPSETGPVHYPACSGPITWSLHSEGIARSRSTPDIEAQMWRQIFAELDTATDYTFTQLPDNTDATIAIHYTDQPAQLNLPITMLAPGTAGLAGITDLVWSGTHWTAQRSVVLLNPTDLRRWNNAVGLRAWVARHELGHALGLGHRDDPASTMARTFSPLLSQPRYQAEDFEQLNALARASCSKSTG